MERKAGDLASLKCWGSYPTVGRVLIIPGPRVVRSRRRPSCRVAGSSRLRITVVAGALLLVDDVEVAAFRAAHADEHADEQGDRVEYVDDADDVRGAEDEDTRHHQMTAERRVRHHRCYNQRHNHIQRHIIDHVTNIDERQINGRHNNGRHNFISNDLKFSIIIGLMQIVVVLPSGVYI